MGQATVNGALRVRWPEGFSELSEAELRQMYANVDNSRWGLRDAERRMVVTVLWQQPNRALVWLADMGAVARRNESLVEEAYKGKDPRMLGPFSRRIAGQRAEGYRFTFQAQEGRKLVETLLFKHKGFIYSVTCMGPEETGQENQKVFGRILDEIQI